MANWAVPVVIEPELEAWVFSASRYVDQILGWQNRNPDLRLQDWFPPNPSDNGHSEADGPSGPHTNIVEHRVKTNKKLIEVALPLDAINAASVREKSIRHGHPSTLHLWWARRPLAVARAVIFAQMVDDPSANPDLFPTDKAQEQERERLFAIIKKLVRWENTNDETVLEQAREEIRESWLRACIENAEHPRAAELFDPDRLPAFHDPFAGGGALPLEAQRLGLEAHASDLNPVAVLINKAMIEIPPRFAGRAPVNPDARAEFARGARWNGKGAQGLAEDVRYYGRWMRDEAEKRIGHLYPKVEVTAAMAEDRPDLGRYAGRRLTVIAWLWTRTVKSPNPAFAHMDVPLASTFMLSRKRGKEAYVEPVVRQGRYRFAVKVGRSADSEATKAGTKLGRGANFRCLMSGSPIAGDYIKAEGQAGRMSAKLMAVVAEGNRERVYLPPTPEMEAIAQEARPEWRPETKISGSTQYLGVKPYGMEQFDQLFTPRQLVALTEFSDLVDEAREQVKSAVLAASFRDNDTPLNDGGDGAQAYADAVGVYLGFAVDKCSDYWSAICSWHNSREIIRNTFARQAIPMVWDYTEGNPFCESTGNFMAMVNWVWKAVLTTPAQTAGFGQQADAAVQSTSTDKFISTDPPYFDNVPYADLSDFFYVWLRRSLRSIFPDLFATLAVPKAAELVAAPYRQGGRKEAERFFLNGMKEAISRLAEQAHSAFPVTIYYAFKQAETKDGGGTASTGWETFLDAVVRSGFSVTGTWPMRTELSNRMRGMRSNALASSIVLVCRRRSADTPTISRREFLTALRAELPLALADLQKSNIAPVDLAQAAIGPGMAIFTRYALVLEADGLPMAVRSALVEINRMLDDTLARQEGDLDADTRFCIAWYEQYGTGEQAFGVAEVLFNAKNTSFDGLRDAGVIVGGKGRVRLARREELAPGWNPALDQRITDWKGAQHLTHSLTAERGGGVAEAARLVLAMGADRAEKARALAYRLYSLALPCPHK